MAYSRNNVISPYHSQPQHVVISNSTPGRVEHYYNQSPMPISPEYRGNPNDGYHNYGYIPEPSSPQHHPNFGDTLDHDEGLRQRYPDPGNENGQRECQRKSTKKTMKETVQELEASRETPVEIIRRVREFIEMEDKRQTGFMAWRKHQKQRWDRFKTESKSKAKFWGLWSVTINDIEGRFGIGIASYFRFLRWLFYLDLLLTIIVLSVITLPYALLDNYLNFENYTQVAQKDWLINNTYVDQAKNCSSQYQKQLKTEMTSKDVSDHVRDALQGTGFMEYTILFYGSYHNVTLNTDQQHIYNYNMSLAYLLAFGIFFAICFVLIIRTIAVGIKENLVNRQSTGIPYSQKVFGSWDYCISVGKMVSRKKNCLLQELRADLNAQREIWLQTGRTLKLKIKLYTLRILINIVVICILCGSFALIYYSSTELLNLQNKTEMNTFVELVIQFLPSVVISLLNVIVPVIFNILVRFEEYSSSYEIKLTLIRITLLRLASLAILLFSLYVKLDLKNKAGGCGYGNNAILCWETYVGQQFYKLVVFDFALMIVVNLIFHTLRRILYNKFKVRNTPDPDGESNCDSQSQEKNSCSKALTYIMNKVGPQEFNLPQNVLDIVYHQSLCWIGVFFCPLISLIVSINFFLLFFIKKFTVYHNCVQSVRPFRASKSNSLFMLAVLISFLLCIIPITLAVGFFRSSKGCGPFRIYSEENFYIFGTLSNLVRSWPSIIMNILFWIVMPPVLVPLIVIICFLIYYYIIVGRGYQRMEDLLREQLSLDGKDKRFLLGEVNKRMRIYFANEN